MFARFFARIKDALLAGRKRYEKRRLKCCPKVQFKFEQFEERAMLAGVPVAVPDAWFSTPINTDLVVTGSDITLIANDFDAQDQAITSTIVNGPSHGTIISSGTDGTFTFRPTINLVHPTEACAGPKKWLFRLKRASRNQVRASALYAEQRRGFRNELANTESSSLFRPCQDLPLVPLPRHPVPSPWKGNTSNQSLDAVEMP